MDRKEIPVILITGYLGSGKTTLLNHILSNRDGVRYAVIVNDIGEVNIDAELIQRGGVVGKKEGEDDLVALQNGCICCSLRMDLVEQLTELVQSGKFDNIVIEASGICEPGPIAQTICAIERMPEHYHRAGLPVLKSIVTVVDALRMVDEFNGGKALTENNGSVDEDIQSLVVEQIEFCNVVLLNKISELSDAQAAELMETVEVLQPHARIIECDYADVPLGMLAPDGEFSFGAVAASAGWVSLLEAAPTEEEEHAAHHPHGCSCGCHEHHGHDHHKHGHEHHEGCDGDGCHCHEGHTEHGGGIDTFVYYRRAPFSIEAFDRFVAQQWPANVIRTKGIVYFDNQRSMSYLFEQAGRQKKLTEAGLWYAEAPANELMALMEREPGLRRDWDEVFGDRMVKLVFIGKNLDREKISRDLDACLRP